MKTQYFATLLTLETKCIKMIKEAVSLDPSVREKGIEIEKLS